MEVRISVRIPARVSGRMFQVLDGRNRSDPTQTGLCKFGRGFGARWHHHPESKERQSSEANSGSVHPYGRYGNDAKTSKTISTIAIFWRRVWPVKDLNYKYWESPDQPEESFGPFGPEVSRRVSDRVSPKMGVSEGVSHGVCPGEKRHININFLLRLTSRRPWDKRLVVPGLTGPKSLCVRLETQEYKLFPMVNRRVVPAWGCPDFQKVYVFKVYVPFSCPSD